jgi:UrcA family protein
MKNFSKHKSIVPVTGMVSVLAFVLSIPVSGQQADPRHIEETTVKATSGEIIQGTPRIWGAGVGHRSKSVRYGDLNLSNPAGVETLYVRLEGASQQVCAPREDYRNRGMRKDWEACYEHAMDAAVEQVGNLGLQEYHLAKTGRDVSGLEQVAGR